MISTNSQDLQEIRVSFKEAKGLFSQLLDAMLVVKTPMMMMMMFITPEPLTMNIFTT